MNELFTTFIFGVMMLALVLGLSCIVMGVISTKSGSEAMKERIEYGFMGISGLALAGLMFYALS